VTEPTEDLTAWTVDLSGITDALAEGLKGWENTIADALAPITEGMTGLEALNAGFLDDIRPTYELGQLGIELSEVSFPLADQAKSLIPSFADLTDRDAFDLATGLFGDDDTGDWSPTATTWLDDFNANLTEAVGELSILDRLGIDESKQLSEREALDRSLRIYADIEAPALKLADLASCSIVTPPACVSTEWLLLDAIAERVAEVIDRRRVESATERALTRPRRIPHALAQTARQRLYCREHRPSPLDLLPISAHAPPTRPQAQDRPTSVGVTAVRGTQLRGSPSLS